MNCGRPPSVAAISRSVRSSITAHYANETCRRQIEKSPLAQIEMSLSTVLVGEFWADDGDYDEPDGDRPDERVAGSGGEQDQSNGSRDADETWSASGVPAGQGVRQAWPAGAGVPEARPAEQSPPPPRVTRYRALQHSAAGPPPSAVNKAAGNHASSSPITGESPRLGNRAAVTG